MDIIALIISILGFAGTCFAIGYQIGKDIHHNDEKKQK